MANLTLNFADASFDGNDDYYINSNGLVYEMGSTTDVLQKKSGGDFRATEAGATVTAGAFTLGHNQDFYFEFEESSSGTDDYEVSVGTETYDSSGNVVGHQHNSIEFDVTLADFDGDGVRDTSAELINGSNTTIAVTRLDVNGNSVGTTNETLGDGEVANTVSWVLSGDNNGTAGNTTLWQH